MLLASELALSRPRPPENYQDTLVSIVEECQRLSSIVGSLLFLARARRTKVEIERQSIDAGVELERIRAYFEAAAQDVHLTLTLSGGAGVALRVDRTLFQRAVSNLVANAIAHTPAGGKVEISVVEEPARIRIHVRDTGEGVSEEAQARVFDRFYRADAARTSASGRIGLGLPIAKSIMELHGGAISMRSRLGEGTTVTLDFPL
jgi:two-component system heavy metal sensor histidine kinase CusS